MLPNASTPHPDDRPPPPPSDGTAGDSQAGAVDETDDFPDTAPGDTGSDP